MASPAGAPERVLVGREAELAEVGEVLNRAADGQSETLLVFGEAGVGKTALVQHAVAGAGPSTLLLSGACLPLQSISVPLLPLRAASRAAVPRGQPWPLDGLESIDKAPALLDAWLQDVASAAPVVLLIDDIQWADESTLDVLMYLVAGPSDRHFALLATVRSELLPDGHPFHRWLADALRLPRVRKLHLQPLDRVGTEAHVASLLGTAPHQSLVDDVFSHTLGNPYLNILVTNGITQTARGLPTDLPADLRIAIRRTWHSLSAAARDVTSLVAVGEQPVRPELIEDVAADLGLTDVESALQEAEDSRILMLMDGERYWFQHPLQAQVLEQSLTASRRRRWHAAYARCLEASLVAGSPLTFDLAVTLTGHHDQAGHRREAYQWSLRSWDLAGNARGSSEMLKLIRRAVDLREGLPDATESVPDLLWRLRETAEAVGADDDELVAVDALLRIIDRGAERLVASELLVRRMMLCTATGAGFIEVEDLRIAAELASIEPTSWQYALALAEIAHAGTWTGDPESARVAATSLAIARASGNPKALCYALVSNAIVAGDSHRPDDARALATEAVAQALAARDWWGFVHAALWEANVTTTQLSHGMAECLRRRREQLASASAPHSALARLAADEASAWLWVGDWRASQDLLRVTLGSDPGPFADISTRLTAALAAAWQDRPTEAFAHLERADELVTGDPHGYRNFAFDVVRSMVSLEVGRPDWAYQAAMAGLSVSSGIPVDLCECLVPLASRALADQAEAARDAARSDSAVRADLDSLVERFPDIVTEPGHLTPLVTIRRSAMTAWYAAEVGRARRSDESEELWLQTARLFEEGGLPWMEMYAWRRAAEALLGGERPTRAGGRRALRRAYELAGELQARSTQRELQALAQSARVPLASDPPSSVAPVALPGLTTREHEILGYLVAGSTYAEIAKTLVISEKTVSSHVSNLLRKTHTASRVELAQLAHRVAQNISSPSAREV
jgi:DNA-binding CsgD family transcriptional regulator